MTDWIGRLRKKYPVKELPKTKKEARIAIAEDLIALLDINALVAEAGTYVQASESPDFYDYHTPIAFNPGVLDTFEGMALSVREPSTKAKCRVCAIGAAAIAAAGLYDRCEQVEPGWILTSAPSDYLRTVLTPWFSEIQLALIEAAFERSTFYGEFIVAESSRIQARDFGMQFRNSDEERLRAIFQNLIDNDGTFKP